MVLCLCGHGSRIKLDQRYFLREISCHNILTLRVDKNVPIKVLDIDEIKVDVLCKYVV